MKIKIYFILLQTLLFITNNFSQTSLLINEFEAKNVSTIQDNYGEYDDWIEILNISNQNINLNGYYITDDISAKTKNKFTINGTDLTIAPGGFLILWADNDLTQGSNHLNFKLGDSSLIALYSPALVLIDSVTYLRQYENISMGRTKKPCSLEVFFDSYTGKGEFFS